MGYSTATLPQLTGWCALSCCLATGKSLVKQVECDHVLNMSFSVPDHIWCCPISLLPFWIGLGTGSASNRIENCVIAYSNHSNKLGM